MAVRNKVATSSLYSVAVGFGGSGAKSSGGCAWVSPGETAAVPSPAWICRPASAVFFSGCLFWDSCRLVSCAGSLAGAPAFAAVGLRAVWGCAAGVCPPVLGFEAAVDSLLGFISPTSVAPRRLSVEELELEEEDEVFGSSLMSGRAALPFSVASAAATSGPALPGTGLERTTSRLGE